MTRRNQHLNRLNTTSHHFRAVDSAAESWTLHYKNHPYTAISLSFFSVSPSLTHTHLSCFYSNVPWSCSSGSFVFISLGLLSLTLVPHSLIYLHHFDRCQTIIQTFLLIEKKEEGEERSRFPSATFHPLCVSVIFHQYFCESETT